ncbi:unnamed protein product [Oikopleura dioica]|uniref:Uncharacterized protein n=1 Tax=Oikopleura dioica TaxID=34765 RepID=E4WXV7_OIKDI|nr:unnamed protein product [Oikopleura dioica]
MERTHEMTPPQIDLIDFQAVDNPVNKIDMERQIILDRRAQYQQDADAEVREEENNIFTRRQRIRRTAQTSQVPSCLIEEVGGEVVPQKKREEKKVVVRQHQPEETFNQRHLVETQHLFPKGNRSIYPSKDLLELANTTKIKRGRPFVVDVERRVIQKGKRGQWHRREDKLQEEPDSENSKTEEKEQSCEYVDENVVDENDISVKNSIQLAIRTTRDKLRNDIERKERMEELDKERKELEAAREQGVDEMRLLLLEREMKKKQKIIDLMSEARTKNPNVGRPRRIDPRKEDARVKPKAKTRMQQKRKLEDDLKKAKEKREKEEQRKIARLEKQGCEGVKKKRIVKTAEEREEAKRIREEKRAKRIMEKELKAAKRAEKEKKPQKTPAHLDWYKLKVGNFFEIQDLDAVTPVLVKINWIDETQEEIRGNYWDICPGESGMALYERTWKRREADEDEVEEYFFCIEDFAQRVSMRNVQRPGVHTVSGVKLTAKSASLMAPRYSIIN